MDKILIHDRRRLGCYTRDLRKSASCAVVRDESRSACQHLVCLPNLATPRGFCRFGQSSVFSSLVASLTSLVNRILCPAHKCLSPALSKLCYFLASPYTLVLPPSYTHISRFSADTSGASQDTAKMTLLARSSRGSFAQFHFPETEPTCE